MIQTVKLKIRALILISVQIISTVAGTKSSKSFKIDGNEKKYIYHSRIGLPLGVM